MATLRHDTRGCRQSLVPDRLSDAADPWQGKLGGKSGPGRSSGLFPQCARAWRRWCWPLGSPRPAGVVSGRGACVSPVAAPLIESFHSAATNVSMSSVLISNADARRIPIPAEDENVASLRKSVIAKLTYAVGRDPIVATDRDWFMATALAVRDHALERWMASTRTNYVSKSKRVYYLSLEFLIGRLLHDSLNNLGLVDRMRAALAELGVDYDKLRDVEHDAALGNGGLGRLAACFMESMATLCVPAHGYGIRYDHGMFRQVIQDGQQMEYPENWLTFGNPWEVARPDATH